jgi:transcriptional regulator with XRE-family HTH domain
MNAGLTQEQLGERAGLHSTYLGGVERGERNVSLNNLNKLAAALQVPLQNLVAFQDTHHDQTVETVKRLIVGDHPDMELFFSAFCSRCKYLNSFLSLEGDCDPFTFVSISCKNCNPLETFCDFLHKSAHDKS